jgi:hypothetical protein
MDASQSPLILDSGMHLCISSEGLFPVTEFS